MKTRMPWQVKAATTPRPSITPLRGARLQGKCACGSMPGPTGECEECMKKRLQRSPIHLQPKLSQPGDALEQEADRVADEIMAGGGVKHHWSLSGTAISGPLQRKCSCGGSGGASGEYEQCKNKGEQTLQRKATRPTESGFAPPIVHEVLNSPGQPLDQATRDFFEPRFGYDLSGVCVHTDSQAAESAEAVSALAYTSGRDVVFAAGRYSPGTSAGQRLFAHELVHTLQQNDAQQPKVILRQATGGSRKLQILEPGPASLQSLVDAANTLQRYVGSIYSSLAEKTSPTNPVAPVFFPEVSTIDGEIGEILRQLLLGLQLGQIPDQQYADTIFGLRSAKKKLDSIVFRAGLGRPAKGGDQSIAEFVDPYGERVDLRDVHRTLSLLLRGVTPGTPVEYGTDDLLHK
jgi:hypothetical protein